jgi:hypothetical protein
LLDALLTTGHTDSRLKLEGILNANRDQESLERTVRMSNTSTGTMCAGKNASESGRLGLNERLSLISLIEEGSRSGCADSPLVADLFAELATRVDSTVRGAKIDQLKPDGTHRGFRLLEINAETGENLGRLNMLYLKKPIPCYYLVYVEVAAPFRNKGLGNRILMAFSEFLIEKSALGILDNIIPPEDPTYDVYLKQAWKPIDDIIQSADEDRDGVYMVFIPPALQGKDLKEPVLKLLHHLRRKRPAIDMRDNELMVERTIEEFKELYSALLAYFEGEIRREEPSPLMRFMFTRYVTKLIGFRRRIGQLLGYTGGESMEQITLDPAIRSLAVQSYAPRDLVGKPSLDFGDRELWLNLPEELKQYPARVVESLPNYRRPRLVSWLADTGRAADDVLTIGDFMDLGFDPTRLKEIRLGDEEFIFERVQPRMLPHLEKTRTVLDRLSRELGGMRVKNALVQCNLSLLAGRDRGNGYVLRRKVPGIHWEEAIEQLQTVPRLKALNASTRVDRLILATIRRTVDWLNQTLDDDERALMDGLTYFVSWDLPANQPRIVVDVFGSSLETIWIA